MTALPSYLILGRGFASAQQTGPGGDDPCCLALGLIGWQVAEPFVDELFAQRTRLLQGGGERRRVVQGEQVGRITAVEKPGLPGVETMRSEDPEFAFGGDPAGDVGVGDHNRVLPDPVELAGLLIGQRCSQRSDT